MAILKTLAYIRELERLQRASLSPDKMAKFLDVIRNDWGFNIYRAVSDTKVKLSAAQRADFALKLGDIDIEREISRADFERWITHDIQRIEETVDDLLNAEGCGSTISTACSSPAAVRSFRRCAASSRRGLAPTGWRMAKTSSRSRSASP